MFAKHQAVGGSGPFVLELATGTLYAFVNGVQISGASLPINTWTHLLLQRSGTRVDLYTGGVKGNGYTIGSGSLSADSNPLYVGTNAAFYLDEVRITKGVARVSGDFTPPTASFPRS